MQDITMDVPSRDVITKPLTQPKPAVSGIVYETGVTITPDDARKLLENVVRDYESPEAVDLYAKEMRAGAWINNGQAIIISKEGRVLDGVQRLRACILADVPFTTLVARNAQEDTLHTIDQHRKRDYTQVLEARGYKNTSSLIRTMSKLIRIENGTFARGHQSSISWSRFDRVLDANPELIEAAEMALFYRGCSLHSTPRPVLAFMAIKAGKRDVVKKFLYNMQLNSIRIEVSKDLEDLQPDNAATKLADQMDAMRATPQAGYDVDTALALGIKAFNDFDAGKKTRGAYTWKPEVPSEGSLRLQRKVEAAAVKKKRGRPRKVIAEVITTDLQEDLHIEGDLTSEIEVMDDATREAMEREEAENQAKLEELMREQEEIRIAIEIKTREEEKRLWNSGLPVLEGYPGLAEGRFNELVRHDEAFSDRIANTLRAGIESDAGNSVVADYLITPEIAQNWLNIFNRDNRQIQHTHIDMIARDIKSGHWRVNAQPICFSGNPFSPSKKTRVRLLNGQHRLKACVQSGEPIEVPIAINIPEAAFATYDLHTKRNISVERGDSRVLFGAAKFQWRVDKGYNPIERIMPTTTELILTLEAHPGMADAYPLSRKAEYAAIATAGVMTFFIYHVRSDAPEIADEFLRGMTTGTGLREGDPVGRARTSFVSVRNSKSRKSILNMLLDVWEAHKDWLASNPNKHDNT